MSYEVFQLRVLGIIARADKTLKVGFQQDRDEGLYYGFSDGKCFMGNSMSNYLTIKDGAHVYRVNCADLGFSD